MLARNCLLISDFLPTFYCSCMVGNINLFCTSKIQLNPTLNQSLFFFSISKFSENSVFHQRAVGGPSVWKLNSHVYSSHFNVLPNFFQELLLSFNSKQLSKHLQKKVLGTCFFQFEIVPSISVDIQFLNSAE